MKVAVRQAVDAQLDSARAAAWRAYLGSTKGLAGPEYEHYEPWAWVQLEERVALAEKAALERELFREARRAHP